jgi:hypothetical protein
MQPGRYRLKRRVSMTAVSNLPLSLGVPEDLTSGRSISDVIV